MDREVYTSHELLKGHPCPEGSIFVGIPTVGRVHMQPARPPRRGVHGGTVASIPYFQSGYNAVGSMTRGQRVGSQNAYEKMCWTGLQ